MAQLRAWPEALQDCRTGLPNDITQLRSMVSRVLIVSHEIASIFVYQMVPELLLG